MPHQFFLINLVNLFTPIKRQLSIFEHGFPLARASQIHEEETCLSAGSEELGRFSVIVSHQFSQRDAWKMGHWDIFWERRISIEMAGRWHVYKG